MVSLQSPKPEFQEVVFWNDAGWKAVEPHPSQSLSLREFGRWVNRRGNAWMGYFEFDNLPIAKNKRNATTAMTIKDTGLSSMPTEDPPTAWVSVLVSGPNLMIIPFSNSTTTSESTGRIAGPECG
jgi:hypothetical protein